MKNGDDNVMDTQYDSGPPDEGAPTTGHGDDKRAELRRRLEGLAARDTTADRYRRHVNPYIARTLDGLGIDVTYVRGSGTSLYDAEGNVYLDFAGAYGALPFGHNPPRIWEAIADLRESAEPSLTQPSVQGAAALLGERLVQIAPPGLTQAWFCNSGAEAVEAAIKIARAATGRHRVVATRNSFHGKTLGALSATGRPRYQEPFGAPVSGFAHIPFNDVAALTEVFAEDGGNIAAFMVETVQGEGGIHLASEEFLVAARDLCTRYGARLVIDEVQTGLGRTGRLFGCEHSGVVPDIMPLAKALGGGMVPIGAVLFGETSLSEDFGLRHTSTFGGNAFCARVGLRALELLTENGQGLVREAADRADLLRKGLDEVRAAHPRLVTDVRGQGLLMGVELTTDPDVFPRQGLFRSLADQEGLAGFLCGYLLRNEGIRLAPTYFSNSVLRVEPPLTVSEDECRTLVEALHRGLELIEAGDSARFFRHLLPAGVGSGASADTAGAETGAAEAPAERPVVPRDGEPRWAFVAHPTDMASYASYDSGLGLPGEQVRILFDRMNQCRNVDTPAAMYVGSCRVVTDTGETSYGEIFALPYGARRLLDMPAEQATELVQQAVDEAVRRGAQLVGLGAYTSVVTANAAALDDRGVPITTGNAYTVAAGVDGLQQAALRQGTDLASAGAVVLGAAGAIGRASSMLLAERVGRLVLVGNPAHPERSEQRLAAVAEDVAAHLVGLGGESAPESGLSEYGALARAAVRLAKDGADAARIARQLAADGLLTTSLSAEETLPQGQLVLAATSTPDQIVRPELLRPDAAVCDVSQPPNVGDEVRDERPDVTVVAGGLIRMPGDRDTGLDFGLPYGVTYACTAETMIAAHRLDDPVVSQGERLSGQLVRTLRDDAARLGFRLHLPERRADTTDGAAR